MKPIHTIAKFIRNPLATAQTSAMLLLILGFGAAVTGYLQRYVFVEWLNVLDNPVADFYANASAELISIAITVLIIDRANIRERKDELIFLIGSEDNSTALSAVRLLRHKGWLVDGSLTEARLPSANLAGADLRNASLAGANLRDSNLAGANLRDADLTGADLTDVQLARANLRDANLAGAVLHSANLEGASLWGTNLEGANLWETNLTGARLWETKLAGASLWEADLQEADLRQAKLTGTKLEDAILPDGTAWTPETDMTQFTDPTE